MINIAAEPHSPVRDLVTGPPPTVPVDSTLREAAILLRESNVSCALLADGRIVTERDLAHGLADGLGPGDGVVNIAVPHPICVGELTSIVEAAELMLAHHVRHLVVDQRGTAVGIVSIRDIAAVMILASEPVLSAFLHQVVTEHSEIWVG